MQEFTQLPGNALNNLYADGCVVSYTTNTTATISAGQVRDSTNSFDILVSSPLLLNMNAKGVNGLDAGTFAANSTYYVYVLYDASQQNSVPQCVASLSPTQPVMPFLNNVTFSNFRMIGVLFSDATPFLKTFITTGNARQRYIQWNQKYNVLSAGTALAFTNVNLSSCVPASNFGRVQLESTFVNSLVGTTTSIKSSIATGVIFSQTGVSTSPQQFQSQFHIVPSLNLGVPVIAYVVSRAGDTESLDVTGFEFNI